MSSRLNRTIYVGNLPGDIRKREIEDLFLKYGPIVDVELKIPARPPGYAFVEFEDRRDAEDAVYGRDGYDFDGCRLRVELAHGGRRPSVDRYSSYNGSGSSRGSSRRSDYRVLVTGLPSSASWQDLKDHMRRAGDVCFSEVYPDRHGVTGIVDYTNYDDMKYAIKKLDDSLFKNAFSRAYIRVREYESQRSYSRSPSRSPYSRSRSPSRSRSIRFVSIFIVLKALYREYFEASTLVRMINPQDMCSKSPRDQRPRSASPVKSHSPSRSRSPSRSKSPAPRPSRKDGSPNNSPGRSPSHSPVRSD